MYSVYTERYKSRITGNTTIKVGLGPKQIIQKSEGLHRLRQGQQRWAFSYCGIPGVHESGIG